MFVRGYEATVTGRPAHVQASPDGLVLLPVPAGDSQVQVRYVGPLILRAACWTTFTGWLWRCSQAGAMAGRRLSLIRTGP